MTRTVHATQGAATAGEGVPHTVAADAVTPQPWRNGGGRTRELLAWPSAQDWLCRISRADIDADGPFSAFPGVERWFTVLGGAGVALSLPGGERVLRPGDAPLSFDGADAPGCRLIDGPTLDLNLMSRQGRGSMLAVQTGTPWTSDAVLRALYTTVPGQWQGGGRSIALAAHTLLWCTAAPAIPWRFDAAPGSAWWLAWAPADVPTLPR